MLAIADSMASAGFAVVAIDLPLHGLAPGHPLYSGSERTFNLDLVDNTTGAPGADGFADSSGTHFINLASLLTSRDNARQGIADLFALTKALATMDVVDDSLPDFDTSEIYFIGHSLGGILGSVFLAQESTVKAAVIGMPGGGIAKLLDGSITFGPRIAAGLATKGVIKGTAAYESFLGATQTVIDSADPINYTTATGAGRGVLLFEVIGDGANSLADQVVPNNVMAKAPTGTVRAPLAGTDPLATYLGLTPVSNTTSNSSLKAWLRFTAGDHGSLLSPAASQTVTTVMQGAMATFLATNGATVSISNTTVVQ
jgi:pimeloyl-ACP methyl ester carboxylesterase